MKRFQECNLIEKIFRYRWYLLLPFQYFYYSFIKQMKVYQDEIVDGKLIHTENFSVIKGDILWGTLKSMLQGKMKWYYTMDEVKEKIYSRHRDN